MGYMKRVSDDLKSLSFYRDLVSEFIATALLVVIQCSLVLKWNDPNGTVGVGVPIHVGVGMGFIVTALIEGFGEFGGAHMNPAVSIALMFCGRITFIRGLLYCVFQSCGGVAGAAFVYAVTDPGHRDELAATKVNPNLTAFQGTMVELALTAIVMFTILGALNVKRGSVCMPAAPIGMAVGLDIIAMVRWTGASMNPARSLGPAVMMNIWEHHWVYWVGPILGALVATFIHHMLDWPERKELEAKYEEKTDIHEIARALDQFVAGTNKQAEADGAIDNQAFESSKF